MNLPVIPIWKEAPFIRIILPFIAGIIFRYYLSTDLQILWLSAAASLAGVLVFSLTKLSVQFSSYWLYGLFIHTFIFCAGCIIMDRNDTSRVAAQVQDFYSSPTFSVVTIQEPLSEKKASFKSLASFDKLQDSLRCISPRTNILMYFRKDSILVTPLYGNRIAFIKSPERIKNSGFTGDFNYEKYCAQRNIYFQVFLKPSEFIILPEKKINFFNELLFTIRSWVIFTLKKYIPGKKECGLAEALLIGYKDDLDRSLIQSYSNTGVVHVVAISGLHLGLVYVLLKYLCFPLGKRHAGKWMTPVITIAGLWLFSLLAGGSPSVMRSAVMFTFIILGECLSRRSPVINNLAASAFFLLCYDPRWLWDIGFQLSYAALLSILLFMKPIYGLIACKNKIADAVWKLNAVTISAQLLTTPVSIFYFHQFPNLFLITNFIAVPLSSIILIGEIALCAVSYIGVAAFPAGWLLGWLIRIMNGCVEYIDHFPFSLWKGIYISFIQLVLLYIFISALGGWLIAQHKRWLYPALVSAVLFFILRLLKYGSPLHFE